MMPNRKLNKPTDQRDAMFRNMATALLWNGKLVTTETRAKEIRPIVEKLISIAVAEYKNTETVTRKSVNDKQQEIEVEKKIDKPSKLHARRQIMAYLYNITEVQQHKEKREDFEKRTAANHPVVEKLFNELAPKYDGKNGGYTRIMKLGPRRGDAAEMALIELI
ncbi:MAG: 50S ribosomal protein L17 [Clostridia bacterium]|nr:50S ribosomal protein L17 [Clostridia bacterium]MBR5718516.1 50S ribosomal protein L17 [Clostridia bacterium]